MFSFKPKKILVFRFDKEKVRSLHMFFVFCNLDVIFLDNNKKIVETAKLRPFSIYTPKYKSKYIIEMPEGYGKNLLKKIINKI